MPSAFSAEDLHLKKKNAFCFGSDILNFEKAWLTKETNLPESPAIKVLLRGLKDTVNLDTLNTGFHQEKFAFLEIVNVLQLFCSNITLDCLTYNKDDFNMNRDKITVAHLGMGVSETWRGVPDGRLRGNALDGDIPIVSGHKQHESGGSNGTSTVCEAKLKISKRNLP